MPRRLISLFVASAMAIGSIGASAQPVASQTRMHRAEQPSGVPKNEPPLKPAGAAGIREAQGIAEVDVWFISGLILAAIIILLLDDDEDATDTTE